MKNPDPILRRVPGKESGDIWVLKGYWDGAIAVNGDYKYSFMLDGEEYELTIPYGFAGDGASVPWWADGLARMGGRRMPDLAWLPHDYLYWCKGAPDKLVNVTTGKKVRKLTRRQVDRVFYNELNKHGLAKFKPIMSWMGVRLAFWKNW